MFGSGVVGRRGADWQVVVSLGVQWRGLRQIRRGRARHGMARMNLMCADVAD
jgi:hypothetical protein